MSTQDIQYKKIDGVEYICEMMPALLASSTLVRLVNMVGKPALVLAANAYSVMDASGEEGADSISFPDVIRLGVEQVFAGLSPNEAEIVLLALMSGVRCKVGESSADLNSKDVFNEHFRGRLLSAYKVWAWSLQCNYRDFIDAARSSGIVATLKSKGEAALGRALSTTQTSPTESDESATRDKAE